MKKKPDQIALTIDTERKRRKNPPRTAFKPGNEHRFRPGQSGNPSGGSGRKKDEHRLTTKALVVDLARRATPNITRALGLSSHASYAQCLSRALIRRALAGDLQAAALILNYSEGAPKSHLTFVDETMTEKVNEVRIIFEESNGDGRLRTLPTTIDGHLAEESKALAAD